MSYEKEVLEKIKYLIACGNDSQAIRVIEQYGHYMEHKSNKIEYYYKGISDIEKEKVLILQYSDKGRRVEIKRVSRVEENSDVKKLAGFWVDFDELIKK